MGDKLSLEVDLLPHRNAVERLVEREASAADHLSGKERTPDKAADQVIVAVVDKGR